MSDAQKGDRFVAVLLTPSPPIMDAAAIVSILARDTPELAPEDLTAHSKTPPNGLVVKLAGAAVTLRFLDEPLAPDRLERAVVTSLAWRSAREAVAAHGGHVVVAPIVAHEAKTAVPFAAVTTMIASAVAEATGALGVYWATADVLAPPEALEKAAARAARRTPAFDLWVKLMPVKGADGADGEPTTGYVTAGFESFSGREIEVEPVDLDRRHIVGRTFAFMGAALGDARAAADGARIKTSETEWISVETDETNPYTGDPVFRLTITEDAAAAPSSPDPAEPMVADLAPRYEPSPRDELEPRYEPEPQYDSEPQPAPERGVDDPGAAPPSGGFLGRIFGKRK